jgi:hypothetical protein
MDHACTVNGTLSWDVNLGEASPSAIQPLTRPHYQPAVGVIEFIELFNLPLDVLMCADIAPRVAASLCPGCQR